MLKSNILNDILDTIKTIGYGEMYDVTCSHFDIPKPNRSAQRAVQNNNSASTPQHVPASSCRPTFFRR